MDIDIKTEIHCLHLSTLYSLLIELQLLRLHSPFITDMTTTTIDGGVVVRLPGMDGLWRCRS